jgi:hypothetical protein
MALWLAISIVKIGIFDQFDQAYWFFSFTMKIQCFGGRRIVYAKGNASKGAKRFCVVPNSIQYVYKCCHHLAVVDLLCLILH